MGMKERWLSRKEELRFKYFPRVVDSLIHLSTIGARFDLKRSPSIAVLVDNTVLSHAITHETGWISTGIKKWGPHDVETGYSARIPVYPESDTREPYRNITFLPGIASLARRNAISLKTSAELAAERFRQPIGRYTGYGYFDFNIFQGISFENVDGLFPLHMGPGYIEPQTSDAQKQRARLARSNDELYQALVQRLGNKNSQDAWHIRTAEKHGLFCFLTMDFKLRRRIENFKSDVVFQSLRTKILTPEELGCILKLIPISPRLLSYHNARSPVRADLSSIEGQRRPRRFYRKDDS